MNIGVGARLAMSPCVVDLAIAGVTAAYMKWREYQAQLDAGAAVLLARVRSYLLKCCQRKTGRLIDARARFRAERQTS